MSSVQVAAPLTSHRPATLLRQARFATSTVFFVHAVLFASWTPYIPAIKTALGLSDASLGVALLGAPVGAVGAMLAAGALVSRWGSAVVIRVTLLGYAVVPVSLGLADSAISLFAALVCWGMFYGSLDVAMNAQAGSVERKYGRSIFASFHACWSLGAFIGAGLGSASVALGISLPWHMLDLGVLIAAVTLPLTRWALPAHAELADEPTTGGHRLARPTPVLIGLGLIVFCGLLCEGAAADWTAVYLRDALSVAVGMSGLGYAAFTGAMFVGRLTGDRLISRFGPRNAVRAGTTLAGLGLAAGLVLNTPSTAITGFAFLGVGLSLVVPSVFSASTRIPDTPPAPALALTTTFGWVGFLCGPPLIGLLAAKLTLPVALGLVAALCLVMTVLASIVPIPRSPTMTPSKTATPTAPHDSAPSHATGEKLTMTADSALVVLDRRVAADLHAIRFPDREWVVPTTGPEGAHVYDVVIVGAGHCGLTVAFALRRRGITNIQVLEAREAGAQGPWTTYGRMLTLRSPKHFNGPDLDIPSLTCEAWYTARYGADSWNSLHKIPKDHWQEYLLWFRRVTGIPVTYQTQLTHLSPGSASHHLATHSPTGSDHLYARKVVFATGAEGSGAWTVPDVVRKSVPITHYTQVADPVDFAALRGKRVGVLGGGASAYDNAATALEHGAARVDLFFRRSNLHRINPHKWTEFSGFLDHFRDLPDHWRWKFMRHILPLNEPPPPETFQRATRHPNFTLRLGSAWDDIHFHDDQIDVTSHGIHRYFDHLLIAVGLTQDLRLRPELADIEPHIARWADVYAPPDEEKHDELAKFPYLGPCFEYTERTPGAAPYLADIYNFTAAATVSHGPSGASINGMKQAANRLANGISKNLFERAVNHYYNSLLEFDQMELDVPWSPTASGDAPARGDEVDGQNVELAAHRIISSA